MNELKFRLWVPEHQKMIYPEIAVGNRGFQLIEYGNLNYLNLHMTPDGRIYNRQNWCDFPIYENAILMQFTGLKDKYGNEIYKDDICLTRDKDEYLICENINNFIYNVLYSENHSGLNGYTQDELEIVGNIHQHPELLKQ